MSDFQSLVKKITNARKIQKDRIEQAATNTFDQQSAYAKMQAPVVQEIAKQAAITQKTLEDQHRTLRNVPYNLSKLAAIAQNQLEKQASVEPSPKRKRKRVDTEESEKYSSAEEDMETSFADKWIQKLYQENISKNSTVTSNELDITKGSIGQKGAIDLPALFNENKLHIKYDDKHESYNKNVTPGLIGLLLLPHRDLEKSNIKPTEQDVVTYRYIMNKVGPSTKGFKYTTYIKPTQGKGIFAYKTVNDLEDRLELLIGSYYAGNTSLELRQDIRDILDEMYKINVIPPSIHKKFFIKFKL